MSSLPSEARLRSEFRGGLYLRRASGDAGTPGVVFLHGLGESGLCFEALAEQRRLFPWTILIPDLPGYGRSPSPPRPKSFAATLDMLHRVLGRIHPGPYVLVGHSMGGVLAQIYAERHGGRISGIVNVDGNVSPDDCTFSGRAAGQTLATFLGGGFADLLEDIYRSGLQDQALRGYYASLRFCSPKAFHRDSAELVRLSASGTLARRMASLGCMKLYVGGAPGGVSRRSLGLLTGARVPVRLLKPSGHWPFIDRQEAFVGVLADFLSSLG